MKFAGMMLLLSGWIIVISSVVLLSAAVSRDIFFLAGLGMQALGLVFAFRKEPL